MSSGKVLWSSLLAGALPVTLSARENPRQDTQPPHDALRVRIAALPCSLQQRTETFPCETISRWRPTHAKISFGKLIQYVIFSGNEG
jgi:hypothetical protein